MSKRLPPRRHCPIGVWLSEVSVPLNRLEKGLPISGAAAPLQGLEL